MPSGKQDVEAGEDTPLKQESTSGSNNPVSWLSALAKSYSWRLLTAVVVLNHLLKGFVAGGGDEGFIGKPAEFILASFGIIAGRLQVYRAIAIGPWALKPILGIMSDVLPMCGYHKMPYLVITSLLAVAAAVMLGFNLVSLWVIPTVMALFLCFLQVATCDLMIEARASEQVKQGAALELGPDFFTFVWYGIVVCMLLGIIVVGLVIQYLGPHAAYLIAAPFMALVLWPSVMNYLGEERVSPEYKCSDKLMKNPTLVSLSLFTGVVVAALLLGGFMLEELSLLILSTVVCFLIMTAVAVLLRSEISKPIIFFLMLGTCTLNIDGALFYFYTASPASFPDGPHLSPFFYTTGIGIASSIGVLIGYSSGMVIFRTWKYTSIIFLTVSLKVCARLLLIPVLIRWTQRFGPEVDIGWILGSTILDAIFSAWCWIPSQVMGAHLTPVGVEAVLQGLTAGIRNLSNALASFMGAYLLAFFNVRPSGKEGDSAAFESLWQAQLTSCLLPILVLTTVPFLIPHKTQTELLITEETWSAVYQSPFERLHVSAPQRQD